MVFASPIFLFLFLPATLAAYFAAPRRWRNGVLLVASLAFYAWGEAPYLMLILGSVAFNYLVGGAIARAEAPSSRKRWLALAVTGNLAVLAVFKYANFAVANVNALAPVLAITPLAVASIPLPLGISFFTFHAISYVIDVYKRNARCRAQPATIRAVHPAVPAADRRTDHPLARHRHAIRRRATRGSPISATACAASCWAWARRC